MTGYSSDSAQQELSNEYQHDRVRWFSKIFAILVLWAKIASALEGLRHPLRDVHLICTIYPIAGS